MTLSNSLDVDVADGVETIVQGTSAFSEVEISSVARLSGRFLAQQYDDQSSVVEASDDMLARSRTPAGMELARDRPSRAKTVSRSEMKRVSTGGPSLYEHFPNARAFMSISRPGFSSDRVVAAIAVQQNDDLWNGPVYLLVLDRRDETWKLRTEADTRR